VVTAVLDNKIQIAGSDQQHRVNIFRGRLLNAVINGIPVIGDILDSTLKVAVAAVDYFVKAFQGYGIANSP
jgi:hypothetical protein